MPKMKRTGNSEIRRRFSLSRWQRWTLLTIAALAVIGGVGYNYVLSLVSDQVIAQVSDQLMTSEELEELTADPDIQRLIAENTNMVAEPESSPEGRTSGTAAESATVSPEPEGEASQQPPTKQLAISSKEEATKLLLSRFSWSELNDLAGKAKGGLTAEEKEEIKSTVLGRLSNEEFETLKVLVVLELQKRQGNP